MKTVEFLIRKEHLEKAKMALRNVDCGKLSVTINPKMNKDGQYVPYKTPAGKPGVKITFCGGFKKTVETNLEVFKNSFPGMVYILDSVAPAL